MLLLGRLLVFVLIYVPRKGGTLKPPDFNSGWMDLWTDKNATVTSKIVLHGLLETPLLVDVQIKEGDSGTIFPATGHIIQNRDLRSHGSQIGPNSKCNTLTCLTYDPEGEDGVMYVYNHRVVKVIAKARSRHRNYGRCKYTDELSEGLMRKFRVRAWKSSSLPQPYFTWNMTLTEPLTEVYHGSKAYPELVISRVRYAFTKCQPFLNSYSDSIGASVRMPLDSPEKTGYVMYEYDEETVVIRKAPEIFVDGDGNEGGETIILNGILEIYVWKSTDINAVTRSRSYEYHSVSIPTVPGMKFDETTKLTALLNTSVQSMDVLINKSVSVSSLIDREMTLSQFFNESLTVGELLNTTYIKDIVRSDSNTSLKRIMVLTEPMRIVLNGEVALVNLLDPNIPLMHVIDNNIPMNLVLNATLSSEIPIDDTIIFSNFIKNSTSIVTLVNSSISVKDSFTYFDFFNESLVLEDIFRYDSILLQFRRILKSVRTINDSTDALKTSVNEVMEHVKNLNISLLNGSNWTKETAQLLDYMADIHSKLDTIKNNTLQLTEPVTYLYSDNLTLTQMTNETLKLSELTNKSFNGFSNISRLLEEVAGLTADSTILPEFLALNETYVLFYSFSESLKIEVQKLILNTNEFTKTVTEIKSNYNHEMDMDIEILELIGRDVSFGDLLNSSMRLKEVLISSVTLKDLERVNNKVWAYLDEDLKISYIVNDHGHSVYLVDVLNKSVETQSKPVQPHIFNPTMTSDTDKYVVRGFIESYDTKNKSLRTSASGLLLWYEHQVIPVLCNFGGMMYGFSSGSVKIMYSNNYPECLAMCTDTTEYIKETSNINLISKIWEIDTDFCASWPCKHGGKCTNLRTSYKCACADGWNGSTCDNNINDCIGKCTNFVKCIDKINDYKCVCKPGWTGKNCNFLTEPYKVLPIKNRRNDQFRTGFIGVDRNLVILGTNDFDNTSYSIIKSRHQCASYIIDIGRLDPSNPNVSVTIELHGSTCFSRISYCYVYWGDGNSNILSFTYVSIANTSHSYKKAGVYDVTTKCVTNNNKETYCPETKSCLATNTFLDYTYKTFTEPKHVMAGKAVEINSRDDVNKTCVGAVYNWRVLHINGSSIIPFTDFNQSQSGRLLLSAGTLAPGIHVIILEIMLKNFWFNDFIVMNVNYPPLYPFIYGGDFFRVPRGKLVYVNASESHDPADDFYFSDPSKLIAKWTFGLILDKKSYREVFTRIENNLSSISDTYRIQRGNVNVLKVNSSLFPLNSFGVAVFKMTKGPRSSTVFQVFEFADNVLPVSLSCIYNCFVLGRGLINFDKLIVDTEFEIDTTRYILTYQWKAYTWINDTFVWKTPMIDDTDKPSITVPKNAVEQGKTYLFVVKVTAVRPELSNTLFVRRTFDFVPHGGTCGLYNDNGKNLSEVISASDLIFLRCKSWSTRSKRLTNIGIINTDSILTYTVFQHTKDAFIEEEPITQRGDGKFRMVLKVGNPERNYETSIKIRIADIYKNYFETSIPNIVSKPVFNIRSVNATEQGADIIRDYIKNKYSEILKVVMSVIDRPASTVFYISTVCSNMYLIKFPVDKPVVPPVLNENGNGIILDMTHAGNDISRYFQDLMTETLNTKVNPTIQTLRKLFKNMTDIVVNISKYLTEYPENVINKALSSVVTNSFSNLAAKADFLDEDTKAKLLDHEDSVGSINLETDDQGELQEFSDETFKMFMEVSSASVSSSLDQYRPTDNIYSAMCQIDEMLSVFGQDYNIFTATISPEERSMLYLKMMRQLLLFIEEAKKQAKHAANSSVRLATSIQDRIKQCQHCDNNASGSAKQLLKMTNACKLKEEKSCTKTSAFILDDIRSNENKTCDQIKVSASAFEFKENVYMYDNDGTSSLITSKVLRIDLKTSGKRVPAGQIKFEQKVKNPKPMRIVPYVHDDDASQFMYHKFLYQKSTESVCIIAKPLGEQDIQSYLLYIKFSEQPSVIDYDIKFHVYKDNNWRACLDPYRMKGHSGVTYLAISFEGKNVSGNDSYNSSKYIADSREGRRFDYNITLATIGCLTWVEENTQWNYDKCQLIDWLYEEEKIVCHCQGVTDMVFGNSFFMAPNAIDFSTVFLKFSPLNQAAVISTLAGILTIYFISVIFLARLDKKDKLKWGITPLRDNCITDEYFYVIKVMTGMRRGAGTRSRVAFHLSGEYDISSYRELFDGVRKEFSTGSVMSFIMSTYQDLGDLQSLRIWHDNSGKGSFASWYLNQVDVYDLKRQKTYSFPFENWLSIENGLVATLPSISTNKKDLESRFFGNLRQRLSEGHIFISIIFRPVMSDFTRVQRASCALVFIMLNMLANALYFNPGPNYQTPAILQIGPFRFTSQQIYFSAFSALFTTVPVCLLIQVFKRTNRRKTNSADKTNCNCLPPCQSSSREIKYRYKSNEKRQHEDMLNSVPILIDEAQFENTLRLPSGFIYISWLIVAGGTITPAFFVMLYSMEWGKQKSEEWLSTLMMSLLESIFLIDPLSVMCISFLLAVTIRSRTLKKDIKESVTETVKKYRQSRGEDDNTVSSTFNLMKSIVTEFKSYKSNPREVSVPIQGDNLKQAQEKQRQYWNFQNSLKDIKLNLVLILLVCVVSYSNRDCRSFLHHLQLSDRLVRSRDTQNFHSIKTPNDMYNWINTTMIPYLFRERDKNGMLLHWTERRMTKDLHLRLGPPRLRQLRIKNGTCDIPYIGRVSCFREYQIWSEEDKNYCIGWRNEPCNIAESVYNFSSPAWTFRSSLEFWGVPLTGYYTTYGGDGYTAPLNVNLNYSIATIDELYKNIWIDRQTRAVIAEFNLYDASTNLFIYNTFMVEFPQTGGAFTSYNIYPLRIYQHHGPAGTWTLVCEVLFVFYLLLLFIKICVRIYRQRLEFFRKFWTVYEFVILLVSVTAICLFCLRLSFAVDTIKRFKQDHKVFVNFGHVVVWDELLVFVLGVLAFLSTIRMLEILSTLKHMKAVVDIFTKCGKDLFWYGVTFLHIFTGFCGLALLLFAPQLESYRNFYQCMGTLFISMIGKSRFTEINETQPVLAKVFFILYILVVVFFFLTIFLSILGASIDKVVHHNRKKQEHDITTFMFKKIKALLNYTSSLKKKKKRAVKISPILPPKAKM